MKYIVGLSVFAFLGLSCAQKPKNKNQSAVSGAEKTMPLESALKLSFVDACKAWGARTLPVEIDLGFSWLIETIGYDEASTTTTPLPELNAEYCRKVEARLGAIESLAFDGTYGDIIPWMPVFKKVKNLSVVGLNQDIDATPLKELKNIESLSLSECAKAGLGFIEAMPLKNFSSDLASLPSLTPLSKLTSLTAVNLEVGEGSVTALDLSPLEKLPLESFVLQKTTDGAGLLLSGVEKLPKTLKVLDLNGGKSSQSLVAALARLTQLKILALGAGDAIDLAPLKALSSLNELYLRQAGVKDFASLPSANLKILSVLDAPLTTVESVKNLSGLEELYLSKTKITSLSGLEGLSNLTVLYLQENKLTNLSAITGLSKLQRLHIHDETGLSDAQSLEPLAKLTQLKGLGLQGIKGPSPGVLSKLTELRSLYFGESDTSDVAFLSSLTKLQILYLFNMPLLKDLKSIASRSFYYLSLSEIGAKDFSALSEYKELATLPAADRTWLEANYGADSLPQTAAIDIYLVAGAATGSITCPVENVSELLASACSYALSGDLSSESSGDE